MSSSLQTYGGLRKASLEKVSGEGDWRCKARQVRLGFSRSLIDGGKHPFCEECALYSSLMVRLSYVKLFTIISSIIH